MKQQLLNLQKNLNEEQAQLYIDTAVSTILTLTYRKTLLPQMETLVIQLASFYVEKDNIGMVTSRSEGAISESYADTLTLPTTLLNQIIAYRLMRTVQYDT